jgi:6-pyruvoyltetrahydropterin/6-carboxytetrahydropterin synthase
MIRITRRYRFSASHRLHSSALGAVENQRLYGKCNNPFGHGHDYILEVTATGPLDRATGLVLPFRKLDQLVEQEVLRVFANRNINLDVQEFASLVPTTENIALVIAGKIQGNWLAYIGEETAARLTRVHLQETDRNGFEVLLPAGRKHPAPEFEVERVNVHA